MDTLCKTKKLQAMNNYYYYNYYKITQFFHNIILYLLIAFTFNTLFCSYSYWFPFFKKLVFDFDFSPKFLFVVVNVIVVFLLGESKLIGYSNSSSSSSSTSEIYDEYVKRSRNFRGPEKTEQSKLEFKNLIMTSEQEIKEFVKEEIESSMQEQKEEEEEEEEEEDFKVAQEEFQDNQELEFDQEEVQDQEIKVEEEVKDQENEVEEEAKDQEENEVEEEAKDQEDEEIRDAEDQENGLMPTEELNRKVEEFIARVNKQRWLEEARLLVCCRA